MKSKIQNYLVLDVETGGIITKDKLAVLDVALTEIALVMVNADLEIVGKYSALIKPYSKTAEYTDKAAEISGITKDMCINEGITIQEAIADTIDFITTYSSGKPMMVGHNLIGFDSFFMENMFLFCGDDIYKYVQKKMTDTLDEAHKIFPESDNYQLGTICRNFEVELVDSHRALPDTIANAEVWIKMLGNARGLSGDSGSINHHRIRHDSNFKY